MSEKKTFEAVVEPGARHGQKIVLRGEAGVSEPGLEPGDVVLVIAQREHAVFQRMRHNRWGALASPQGLGSEFGDV